MKDRNAILSKLQAESRERHIRNGKINPACFSTYDEYMAHQKALSDIVAPKRKKEYLPRLKPDPPKKPIVRPPAVYSNKSPYGIASDYLLGKDITQ
jgi:hypothetical protein